MKESTLKKLRILLTNMPGPKQPMFIEGKRVHWRIASTAGFTNTFALQSIADNVKLTLISNVGFFKDARGLLNVVERIIDEDTGPLTPS